VRLCVPEDPIADGAPVPACLSTSDLMAAEARRQCCIAFVFIYQHIRHAMTTPKNALSDLDGYRKASSSLLLGLGKTLNGQCWATRHTEAWTTGVGACAREGHCQLVVL
jgi:hypothetical protein